MKTTTFGATVPVTAEDISYLLVAALEGGSNYWLSAIRIRSPLTDTDPRQPGFWSDPDNDAGCLKEEAFWKSLTPFTLVCQLAEEDEPDDIVIVEITQERINAALTYLYGRNGGFDMNNHDALDADCFLQFVVFGEVVYG